jgi:hypothetical protein
MDVRKITQKMSLLTVDDFAGMKPSPEYISGLWANSINPLVFWRKLDLANQNKLAKNLELDRAEIEILSDFQQGANYYTFCLIFQDQAEKAWFRFRGANHDLCRLITLQDQVDLLETYIDVSRKVTDEILVGSRKLIETLTEAKLSPYTTNLIKNRIARLVEASEGAWVTPCQN